MATPQRGLPISVSRDTTTGARPLVVVAEDSDDARAMVGMMLGLHGFDVILAADGREAVEAVTTHHPDALVSDMEMPNLDGLGVCRAVRALRAHERLPIIVYTGVDNEDPRLRDAHRLHGAHVISKAVVATKVGELLRQMLALPIGARPAAAPRP